jgi:hypothetical protein
MKNYTIIEGQTILDIALQLYGSVDYAVKLVVDNGLDINQDLVGNDIIQYDADLFSQSDLSNQLQLNNLFLATASELLENTQPALPEMLEHSPEEHTNQEHN